jgi:glycosyltransferase involved in cell wall biosynthesis
VTSLYDFVFLRYPETMDGFASILYRLQVPASLRRSTIVVADSETIRREAMSTYPWLTERNTAVVTPGCDDAPLSAGATDQSRRGQHLLFVGSLEPRKNIATLLDALEILAEQGIRPVLRVVGPSGWKNSALRSALTRLQTAGHAQILGFLSEEALQCQYAECRALIYPSLYEGFGMPVLEALRASCPVLTSKGTVMEEIAGPAAIYFNATDPADIAAKIAVLYSPDFSPDQYAQHRQAVLQKYSWRRSALDLQAILAPAGRT